MIHTNAMKADVKKANITINTKYFKRFLSRSVPCPLRLLFCSFHSFSAYRAVVRVCNCCCCVAIDDAKLSHKLSFAWRVCVCVAALVCLFFFHSVGWLVVVVVTCFSLAQSFRFVQLFLPFRSVACSHRLSKRNGRPMNESKHSKRRKSTQFSPTANTHSHCTHTHTTHTPQMK